MMVFRDDEFATQNLTAAAAALSLHTPAESQVR
jgi:hypothetical protein